MSSSFAKNLRLLRQEKKLTQVTVAADLGISQALLSHYENGVREPSLSFIDRVCDYYDVTSDFLIGRTGLREKPPEKESAATDSVKTESPALNSKSRSVCDAVIILFDLLDQLPDEKPSTAAQGYLGTAVYRLYRALSNCSPDNSKVLKLSESPDFVHSACNADMTLNEIEYTQALTELEKADGAFPDSNYGALKTAYPEQYQALFQLVYDGNRRINNMLSARDPERNDSD